MKPLFFFAAFLFFTSCSTRTDSPADSAAEAVPANFTGFVMEAVPGSAMQKAVKKDELGSLLEDGFVLDGKKHGPWLTYYKDDWRVKSITNYINGIKNGIHLELNNRGQVEVETFYKDDQLHGYWRKFRFGSRIEKEATYEMGVMNGYYREYHNNGKKMKEIPYKDGKIHGTFKQFNDEEELVMQYEYNMGEKVSGGIAGPQTKTAEEQ